MVDLIELYTASKDYIIVSGTKFFLNDHIIQITVLGQDRFQGKGKICCMSFLLPFPSIFMISDFFSGQSLSIDQLAIKSFLITIHFAYDAFVRYLNFNNSH